MSFFMAAILAASASNFFSVAWRAVMPAIVLVSTPSCDARTDRCSAAFPYKDPAFGCWSPLGGDAVMPLMAALCRTTAGIGCQTGPVLGRLLLRSAGNLWRTHCRQGRAAVLSASKVAVTQHSGVRR